MQFPKVFKFSSEYLTTIESGTEFFREANSSGVGCGGKRIPFELQAINRPWYLELNTFESRTGKFLPNSLLNAIKAFLDSVTGTIQKVLVKLRLYIDEFKLLFSSFSILKNYSFKYLYEKSKNLYLKLSPPKDWL